MTFRHSTRPPGNGATDLCVAVAWILLWIGYEWAWLVHSDIWGTRAAGTIFKSAGIGALLLATLGALAAAKRRPPPSSQRYLVFSFVLCAWLFVPAALNDDLGGAAKWGARIVSTACIVLLVARSRELGRRLSRLIAWTMLVSAVVYFVCVAGLIAKLLPVEVTFENGAFIRLAATNGTLFGTPIVRFCGPFTEPSIASAYSLAAAAVWFGTNRDRSIRGTAAGALCFAAGICTLSITGGVLIALYVLTPCLSQARLRVWPSAVAAVAIAAFALAARPLAVWVFPESNLLSILAGIRSQGTDSLDSLSSGRLTWFGSSVAQGLSSVVGVGPPSVLGEGGLEETSQSAPALWLLFGGVPALILTCTWQMDTLVAILRGKPWSRARTSAVQAYVSLESLQLIYGTFLSPGLAALTGAGLCEAELQCESERHFGQETALAKSKETRNLV